MEATRGRVDAMKEILEEGLQRALRSQVKLV